jgi:MSHA biogenesis protein MshM
MIRSYFGLAQNPFDQPRALLDHQQPIFDTLRVHCQQGGLCLVLGQPGTGKSTLKHRLAEHDPKKLMTPSINRTLHTHTNILRILCRSFGLEDSGNDYACEKRLIKEAYAANQLGKMLAPIIDDAHLLDIQGLRKLRLLFEEFPKNHNLILIGQPSLLTQLQLSVNEDIKSRVTFSVVIPRLNPDQIQAFLLGECDHVGLPHATFTEEALALLVRSGDGLLRRARNLTLAALLEAIRDQSKTVDLKHLNRVLLQPHWRTDSDFLAGYPTMTSPPPTP